MDCNVIATGSSGNAVVINKIMLIDCGVPFSALKGIYKDLKIVLLTHGHGDHFKKSTIRRLAAERPTLRFGCCKWLAKELLDCGVPRSRIDIYKMGRMYNYRSFWVSPIRLYHDVPNCGYRLYFGLERGIYITDTGTVEGIKAKDYDLYMIEANYSEAELEKRIAEKKYTGEYVYEERKKYAHLSLEAANDFIYSNIGAKGRYIYLHGERSTD